MKKLAVCIAMISFVAFVSCKDTKKETKTEEVTQETTEKVIATVKEIDFGLESKSESTATGKVSFREVDGVVTLEANIFGLTPGMHAIHIHEKADCSSPDGKSTGGHWNPTFAQHGKWGATEGYHKGDIGNIEADEEGNGSITMQTDEWCIGCGDTNKDILGKAIIVHQGADDFVTQPTGAAGGRVSCGGIIE